MKMNGRGKGVTRRFTFELNAPKALGNERRPVKPTLLLCRHQCRSKVPGCMSSALGNAKLQQCRGDQFCIKLSYDGRQSELFSHVHGPAAVEKLALNHLPVGPHNSEEPMLYADHQGAEEDPMTIFGTSMFTAISAQPVKSVGRFSRFKFVPPRLLSIGRPSLLQP
jgi:hypothetical protein